MPTLPHRLWTMNRGATEDDVGDVYRFHPWRAPGSAPVTDACGTAGGTNSTYEGPGNTFFSTVKVNGSKSIKMGDLGSVVLPAGPSMATYQIGSPVEVKWGLRFNHGGGYQYRLCPATEELLTEDCFMRTPLDFVRGKQALEWKNGTRMLVPDPQYIDEGIIPVGSTWARNPIPVISGQHAGCVNTTGNLTTNATDVYGMLCRQFEPPCLGDDGWDTTPGSADQTDLMGKCSGEWIEGVIVDQVVIPSNLKPGRYVLGFRWDAEQTSQVWNSCSDVTLVAPPPPLPSSSTIGIV